MTETVVFSVSDFVAVLNQTLAYAYPSVGVVGEIANFRVSKNRWVYFDLKDEHASVKCFATVYQLPGPLEDGLLVEVKAEPRLHPLYNFSLNVQAIQPVGEGSLKRAADLLAAKLTAEGLFDPARKRLLPEIPERVGLITSSQSAAFHDFVKILDERWGGVKVQLLDVAVQGEQAVGEIVAAIENFNQMPVTPEVLVITRGGGSAEDLAAFNTEQVTRAVAGSRIPTLVAIGHEIDISLAEMAADQRASTPSNAAQLLVPDKKEIGQQLVHLRTVLRERLTTLVDGVEREAKDYGRAFSDLLSRSLQVAEQTLARQTDLLEVLNPTAALRRGYAIVTGESGVIRSVKSLRRGAPVNIRFADGTAAAEIKGAKRVQ